MPAAFCLSGDRCEFLWRHVHLPTRTGSDLVLTGARPESSTPLCSSRSIGAGDLLGGGGDEDSTDAFALHGEDANGIVADGEYVPGFRPAAELLNDVTVEGVDLAGFHIG